MAHIGVARSRYIPTFHQVRTDDAMALDACFRELKSPYGPTLCDKWRRGTGAGRRLSVRKGGTCPGERKIGPA